MPTIAIKVVHRCKRRYDELRKKGICVRCTHEKARPGRVTCTGCAGRRAKGGRPAKYKCSQCGELGHNKQRCTSGAQLVIEGAGASADVGTAEGDRA